MKKLTKIEEGVDIGRAEKRKIISPRVFLVVVSAVTSVLFLFACMFFSVLVSLWAKNISVKSVVEDLQEGQEACKVGVVDLQGQIYIEDSSGWGSGFVTPEKFKEELNNALEDNSVCSVVIRINSPGGEVVSSDMMYNIVREASKKKKVVSYIETMGASGAYYVAVGSDVIVTHPMSMTGSIGVIMTTANTDELMEKIGIRSRTFKSGKYKDDEGLYPPNVDEEAVEIYQGIVMQSYNQFVQKVAEGRDMEVSEVKKLADGRVYSGVEAVENGLADKNGDFNDALKYAASLSGCESENVKTKEFSKTDFWSELQSAKLFGLFSTPQKYGLYYLL